MMTSVALINVFRRQTHVDKDNVFPYFYNVLQVNKQVVFLGAPPPAAWNHDAYPLIFGISERYVARLSQSFPVLRIYHFLRAKL